MWASGSPQDRKWLYKQLKILSVRPWAVGFLNPTQECGGFLLLGRVSKIY